MYVLNMTKLPIEMRPVSTCCPPTQSTTRNVSADQRLQQRIEQSLNAHQLDVLRDVLLGSVPRTAAVRPPPARRRGSCARPRDSPARGWRCRRTSPGSARSGRESCGRRTITAKLTAGAGRTASSARRQSARDHDGDRQHERQAGLGPVHDARTEHHAHGVQVVGGARHDVAGARARRRNRARGDTRWRKRSLRRSYSISREMPMMITRIQY